jgi:AcrR family transcriptional regulator
MAAEPALKRLPRGRHGLSREQVVQSQRGRMLEALAEAVAEKGYAKTSVADVLARAGVSRETFYEQFSSKEDCFLETFDLAGEILLGRLTGMPAPGSATERFDRLLGAYLDALASEPAYARVYLVDAHAAGPEALRRRVALQARFTDALAELFDVHEPHERLACELLVAAIGSMVTTRLALGEHAALHELRAPIVDLVRRVVHAGE